MQRTSFSTLQKAIKTFFPGCTFGNTAAKWDIILNNIWLCYTKNPPGNHAYTHKVDISFLAKKIKVEPKTIHRKRDSSQETGRASFKIQQRARRHEAHAQITSTVWGRQQNYCGCVPYQHWLCALCFHFSLRCILALHGRLDHQLLFYTSSTCPAFISLHSWLKMQVRKSATWTAVGPWLCKTHACQ